MAAFVRADRQRSGNLGQHRIVFHRQRLLDQFHPETDQMRREIAVDLRCLAFIGVNDDPRFGSAVTNRFKPGHVIRRAELDL